MLIDSRTHEELEGIPLEAVVKTSVPIQPKEDEVLATLYGVRARLEKGWIQGDLRQGDNYCLIGAVEKESFGVSTQWASGQILPIEFVSLLIGEARRVLFSRTYRRTIRALKRQAGRVTFIGLAKTNDVALSKQEVLDLVDATIERRKRHR